MTESNLKRMKNSSEGNLLKKNDVPKEKNDGEKFLEHGVEYEEVVSEHSNESKDEFQEFEKLIESEHVENQGSFEIDVKKVEDFQSKNHQHVNSKMKERLINLHEAMKTKIDESGDIDCNSNQKLSAQKLRIDPNLLYKTGLETLDLRAEDEIKESVPDNVMWT